MKTNKKTKITVLTLVSFLAASAASAQVVGTGATGAVNSATQGAANIGAPHIPSAPPATATSANAAQSAATAASTQTAANAQQSAAAANAASRPITTPPANTIPVATPNPGAQSTLNADGQSHGVIDAPSGNMPATTPVANDRAREAANPNSAVRNATRGNSETTGAVDSSLAGSAVIQGDVITRDNMYTNAAGHAAANDQINGLATGAELSTGASAVLTPAETVRDIRGATQSSRESVHAKVNAKLETGDRVVADINRQARELKGDARIQFKAAADNVRDAEKALKRSLNDARKASNDTWSEAQARLASDYEAYASAIARAHAAATVSGDASTPTR